jgi:predicted O-methyltransferase YrrM
MKRSKQKIVAIQGDSHSIDTLNKIKRILNGKKLDFLFIDGDHSYKGVKKDFEMYSPLVRKGGIIAFHDIIPDYYTRFGKRTDSWAVRFLNFGKK